MADMARRGGRGANATRLLTCVYHGPRWNDGNMGAGCIQHANALSIDDMGRAKREPLKRPSAHRWHAPRQVREISAV
eukprot:7200765-Prymnesium_polylepis.1